MVLTDILLAMLSQFCKEMWYGEGVCSSQCLFLLPVLLLVYIFDISDQVRHILLTADPYIISGANRAETSENKPQAGNLHIIYLSVELNICGFKGLLIAEYLHL